MSAEQTKLIRILVGSLVILLLSFFILQRPGLGDVAGTVLVLLVALSGTVMIVSFIGFRSLR
jgi:hypothetical protein